MFENHEIPITKVKTALHRAIERNELENVRELLDSNVDVNAKDNDGNTPLHYAALHGNLEIVKLLLRYIYTKSVELEAKDNYGETPLHKAIRGWAQQEPNKEPKAGHQETILFLLRAGANTLATDNNGNTMLHFVAMSRSSSQKNIEKIFNNFYYDTDLDINKKNNRGWTPLHTAVFFNSLGVMERLLDLNADYNALSNKKKTPSDIAKKYKRHEALNLIYKLRAPQIVLDLEATIRKQQEDIAGLKEQVGLVIKLLQQNMTQTQSSTPPVPLFNTTLS